MKKVFAIVLALLLCVSLCCGCSEEESQDIASIDVSEVPDYVIGLMEDVDSVRVREMVEMSLNTGSGSMVIRGDSVCEFSKSQGMVYVDSHVSNMGINISAQMYVEKQGNNANVYMSMNEGSSWGKMNVPVSSLATQDGYHEDMLEFGFYLSAMTNIVRTQTDYNGTPAYLITGQVDYNKIVDFVMEAGFADAISQGSADMQAKIKELYADLEPVEISVYLDAESGLPLQINADPTAMFNSFYANAGAAYGSGMNVALDYARISITFEDYNNVNITIPDAAKSGSGMGFSMTTGASVPSAPDTSLITEVPIMQEAFADIKNNFVELRP